MDSDLLLHTVDNVKPRWNFCVTGISSLRRSGRTRSTTSTDSCCSCFWFWLSSQSASLSCALTSCWMPKTIDGLCRYDIAFSLSSVCCLQSRINYKLLKTANTRRSKMEHKTYVDMWSTTTCRKLPYQQTQDTVDQLRSWSFADCHCSRNIAVTAASFDLFWISWAFYPSYLLSQIHL